MVRLKALVFVGDEVEDYGDLLAIGWAEANVKDVLFAKSLDTRSERV